MNSRKLWSNVLVFVGLVLMLVGAVDPLEGSVIILPGSVLIAIGAMVGKSRYQKLFLWSSGMIIFGVGAMIILSMLGGLGGKSGHSLWWGLFILPYPIAWFMSIIGIILRLVELLKKPKEISSTTT
ncbi:MAG: hypothetical protein ACE14V_06555 [bacterium]